MNIPEQPGNEQEQPDPNSTGQAGEASQDAGLSEAGAEDNNSAAAAENEDFTSKEPNIIFVGKELQRLVENGEETTKTVRREPPTHINNGMDIIALPEAAVQLAGAFHHPEAGAIVTLFPSLYKVFKKEK